jgi:hypothetical protein
MVHQTLLHLPPLGFHCVGGCTNRVFFCLKLKIRGQEGPGSATLPGCEQPNPSWFLAPIDC